MRRDNDQPLVHLHWALVLSLVYLVVLGEPAGSLAPSRLFYIAGLLAGGALVPRLPFSSERQLGAALVAFDTGFSLIGLAMHGPSPSQDLVIGYFLAIVIASLGDSQARLAGAALLGTALYALWMLRGNDLLHSSPLLLRLPFLFVATLFYGAVMQRVRSERQYRRMFDDSPHPMWIQDEESHALLDVNDAALREYGYSRGELLAMSLEDLRPAEDAVRRKDGGRVEVEVVETPVLFAGRHARLAIVSDMTERRRAEAEVRRYAERYRTLFEGVPLGIYRTGSTGEFEDANPALARLLGYADGEALRGVRAADLCADAADWAQLHGRVERDGGVRAFELDLRRRDGAIVQGAVSARLVRDERGRPVGCEGVVEDVTERRKSEEMLLEALQKSEESDWVKGNFLATMSHEIRTPLNIILGYSELLGADGDEASAELVQAIRRASHRLINTVHGMLDLAKLQSSSFECRPVELDLVKVVEERVEPFLALAKRKGLDLGCEFEVRAAEVRFDEYCLTKALDSLLDNAVKFTPRGEIRVRVARDVFGGLRVEVKDTGIGISAEHLPRLFEPFVQEHLGDSRPFEGAGVSLAVAKRLVELNGGKITVESEKGVGTLFAIHVHHGSERVVPAPPAGNGNGNGNGRPKKPAILVVEDDEDSQSYVRMILGEGFRILEASTATEARQILARDASEIRLVLMDVSLKGDEDGLDLTRHVRSHPVLHDVPVVATTAHALQEWRLRAFEAGCNSFLSKPFSPRQLLAVVEQLLGEEGESAAADPPGERSATE